MAAGSVSNDHTVSIGARTDVVGQVEICIRERYRAGMAVPSICHTVYDPREVIDRANDDYRRHVRQVFAWAVSARSAPIDLDTRGPAFARNFRSNERRPLSLSMGASRGCVVVLFAQPFVSCPRMTPAGWAVVWKLT